jgi:purine-binding chemotaxis protein CheW
MANNLHKADSRGNKFATEESLVQSEEQCLTFLLAGEDYGVNILWVEEIRGLERWTRIPNVPKFVRGVVNIRGAIIPVIDLRERFQLAAEAYGEQAVIIVLRGETSRGNRALGIVADAVSDVHDAINIEVGVTPEFGNRVNTEYIAGVATAGEKMIMLLDVDKLVNDPDITGLETNAVSAA